MKAGPNALLLLVLALLLAMAEGYFLPGGAEVREGLGCCCCWRGVLGCLHACMPQANTNAYVLEARAD